MLRELNLAKLTGKVTKGTGLIAAVAAASIVGGASTAIVLAAIPGSNGTISACYNKTGALKVIDAEAGKTCNSKQTALNWSQSGGDVIVRDANGQSLGTLLSSTVNNFSNPSNNAETEVYSPTLDRVVPVGIDSTYQGSDVAENVAVGQKVAAYFTTSDCTGLAYMRTDDSVSAPNAKILLFRYGIDQSDETHATVNDSTQPTTVTTQSAIIVNDNGDANFCFNSGAQDLSVYPLTTVSLPFTTPVVLPLRF